METDNQEIKSLDVEGCVVVRWAMQFFHLHFIVLFLLSHLF
jgi:hypothetical protein